MKTLLLQNTNIAGVNPAQIIDKDGNVLVDYETTVKVDDPWDRLDSMLKNGPVWDHLDKMLGE